jgi:hypothetical protein
MTDQGQWGFAEVNGRIFLPDGTSFNPRLLRLDVMCSVLNSAFAARTEELRKEIAAEKEKVRQWEESFKALGAQARVWAEGAGQAVELRNALDDMQDKLNGERHEGTRSPQGAGR